jgi:hypothetical protein
MARCIAPTNRLSFSINYHGDENLYSTEQVMAHLMEVETNVLDVSRVASHERIVLINSRTPL